jgi:hypothetical protein
MAGQKKDVIKTYYIEQMGKFFSRIADIPDKELKGLPAFHIPCLGFTDEMPKIAFYGMETNGWFGMLSLKERYNKNPSSAYDYITKDVFTPSFVIKCAQPRKSIFWKYVISLMSGMSGLTPQKLKTEDELKKHTLIWGNILSLERYHISAKRNGVKKEIYNKVYNETALFNTLPNGYLGPTYIIKACQPKLLFILYSGFNMQNWLRNDFGIEREMIHRHLCHAHIKETDTHVFKMPHPVFINKYIGWHKSINDVLGRYELTERLFSTVE